LKQRNFNLSNKLKIFIAAAAALFFIAAGTAVGSNYISFGNVLKAILSKAPLFDFGDSLDKKIITVVWTLRLPRTIMAFLVGGCIAIAGTVVQSVLKNPLASPYTLGVSSGASLGAALIMLSGLTLPVIEGFTLPLSGFVFGLLTVFLVVIFSSRLDRNFSNNTVVLFGMVVSLFVNAILITLLALYRDELKNLIIWQMGSFAQRGWSSIRLLLPFFIAGAAGVMYRSKEMDVLTFGDEHAASCGINTKNVKGELFLYSSVLTGGAVALSGTIGFVDLIAPHIARRIVGSAHRLVVPLSFFIGGTLCILADLIARTVVAPSELPVGAVTALVGAPFFLWVYFKK